MIKTELLRIDDKTILVKTYSTEGFYIKQVETENKYTEAIDVGVLVGDEYKPKFYTYIETNEPIETSEINETSN